MKLLTTVLNTVLFSAAGAALAVGASGCASASSVNQPAVVSVPALERSGNCNLQDPEAGVFQRSTKSTNSVEQQWVISMGQRPTGGYAIDLQPHASLVGDTLQLLVQWREPGPGAIVSQAFTQPCVSLLAPPVAATRLEVIDQHGQQRFAMDVADIPPATNSATAPRTEWQ